MESNPKPASSVYTENPRVIRSVSPEPRLAPPPPGPNFSVGDVYYIVFRQKWKIIVCSVLGLAAAAIFYKTHPPAFRSEAKLLIRYVAENRELATVEGEDLRMKAADQPVINAEIQIMTSGDLLEQAARDFGPSKILAQVGGGDNSSRAAGVLRGGLVAATAGRSSVVRVELTHPDPSVVQPALTAIVERYLKRHHEIHRSTGMVGTLLAQETDQARARLTRTDEELRKARNRAGVISLEVSKANYASQITSLKNQILEAEAQLFERKSLIESRIKSLGTPDIDNLPEPTANEIRQYQGLLRREAGLQRQEQDLLAVFTDDNVRVKQVRDQLERVEKLLRTAEEANPKIALRAVPPEGRSGGDSGSIDIASENARVVALEARIRVLNTQLEAVRSEAASLDQMELEILQLTRLREQQEASYRDLSASMDRMRINDALGSGSVTNISQLQSASPPYSDNTKTMQVTAGLSVAGLALGLAWAFALEMFLDRSVRRPADVKRTLRLPLFLSIPRLNKKELMAAADFTRLALPGPKAGSKPPQALNNGKSNDGQVATFDKASPLHAFHETLRDRLISYFESINLTHKPKLVAVTGLGDHAGVTTTAAGLAASLSETGEGNVLLVDMTVGQGSAQQFYHGKVVCGLEEVLNVRNNAQVDDNLYVVGQEAKGEHLSRILPHRFNKIVPKLKASNFDYIIFDMPPVSQISITPRLAGFMDMTLLVLESEKTDKDVASHAADLLSQSKTHVGVVLNKTKSYVPTLLHQDREFLHGI